MRSVKPVSYDKRRILLREAQREHGKNVDIHEGALTITFRDDRAPSGMRPDDFSPFTYLDGLRASGVPIYGASAWFDGAYARANIHRFLNIKTPGSRLVLGPWNHGGDDHVMPLGEMRPTGFDFTGEVLRFFDRYAKGAKTGIDGEPPVHYFTMIENKWKTAETWPPPGVTPRDFFLSAGGALAAAAASAAASDDYAVDDGVGSGTDSRWRCLSTQVHVQYPDRAKLDRRLLVYSSAPLPADTEVTGHPIVTLQFTADANDAQVFVYLEDEDEKGRVNYVTEGWLRALHRKISDTPPYVTPVPYHSFLSRDALPLVPNEPAEMVFDLMPVSYLFKSGHKIRIALAGADADHFRALDHGPTHLRVFRGGAAASKITLPIAR